MKEKLHHIHIAIFIYMVQSGVVLFTLPRLVAEYFGTNGWIFIFILSGIGAINIFLISLVYRFGQGRSIFQILEATFPKLILFPLYLFLIVIWSLTAVIVAKQFMILVVMIAFPTMSAQLLLIGMLILALMFLSKGIYNMLKATTFFFFLTIWTLFSVLFHLPDFEFIRFTPFILKGDTNIIQGSIDVYGAFLGLELSLLLFPYVSKNTKFIKSIYAGHLFTTMVYVIISIISFGFFSLGQLLHLMYPTITLMKFIETPMIERLDNLIFSAFILKSLVTVTFYYWGSVQVAGRIFPKVKDEILGFILVFVTFFISWLPERNRDIEMWLGILSNFVLGIAFGLPLFLLLVVWLQNLRGKKHVNQEM